MFSKKEFKTINIKQKIKTKVAQIFSAILAEKKLKQKQNGN